MSIWSAWSDRRVMIQAYTPIEDEAGGIKKTWVNVRKESAKYEPGSAAEKRIAAREQSSLMATFTFHSSTLTRSMTPESHRLVFEGHDWDIQGAYETRRGRYVEVIATVSKS